MILFALKEVKMGTVIRHGFDLWMSKYEMVQHCHSFTDTIAPNQGWIEVLEIKDPPSVRKGNIVHVFWIGQGFNFFEFIEPSCAINAYKVVQPIFASRRMEEVIGALVKQPGYISCARSIAKRPWFYEV